LIDPGCSTGTITSDFQNGLYPFQIQTALVNQGLITTVILVPAVLDEGSSDDGLLDPRISQPNGLANISLFKPAGGLLWVEIEGSDQPCLLDQNQPDRVICGGLSLSAGGPVKLNLCWQGFDGSQSCPPGFGKHSEGSCVPLADLPECSPDCPAGYSYSDIEGLCILSQDPEEMALNPNLCPSGLSVLSEAACCGGVEIQPSAICPAVSYYSSEQSSCRLLPSDGSCPEGYISHPDKDECVRDNLTTNTQCTMIELSFQRFKVSVRESTRCYKDPVKRNEILGSLKPFTIVEVLGIDEDGETLLIENPDYEVPCWASLGDFYSDKLDLSFLPIIKPE
jgi:hypothetical protein